jgi:ADP-ribose pyrophosphatase YjhB (NUDIX family)
MKWMEWTQKLQAIAQNGLTYAKDPYDIERYQQLQQVTAEIISDHTKHDQREVQDYLNKETGYATPKIDVRGVVIQNEKILLVKEKVDQLWTLPGGWADIHYSAAENVEREVFEESGFEVKAEKLLAVYDRSRHGHYPEHPHSIYKMFFLCSITGGGAQTSMETSAVDFFDPDHLPPLSIGRVTEKQIHRMFELRNLNQVDFD